MFPLHDHRLSLALSAAIAVGCGAGPDDECPDDAGLSDIHNELGTDYLAHRRRTVWDGSDSGLAAGEDVRDFNAQGEVCSGAGDVDTCRQALDTSLPGQLSWGGDGGGGRDDYDALVSTKGDTVRMAETKDEVVAFFGSIDTEAKALFTLLMLADYEDVRCGGIKEVSGGWEVVATVARGSCDRNRPIQRLKLAQDGTVEVLKKVGTKQGSGDCDGRRPDGLRPAPALHGGPVARHLAHVAHLEAAAVVAFERLAVDLARYGAPPSLVERARAAAADEVQHAAMVGALARRWGATPPPVEVGPHVPRPLLAFALENAVEGCVRETFGVVEAAFRARSAPTPALRGVYARIASDEARHAELSWDVARWVETRLTPAEAAAMRGAMVSAHAELQAALGAAPRLDVEAELGAPTPAQAVAMAQVLAHRLAA